MISPTGTNEIKPHINTNRERNLEGKGGGGGDVWGYQKPIHTHTYNKLGRVLHSNKTTTLGDNKLEGYNNPMWPKNP